MNNLLFLSIIIPHHNIPSLLERCLFSIPFRDDVEIIVVDDASSPDNLEQIKVLEKKYPKVQFLYLKQCFGAGKARNLGLSIAKGKYVLFADSDDFFMPCLNLIFEDYHNLDYDLVYFNANSLDTDSYLLCDRSAHLNWMHKQYSKNKEKGLFYLRYVFGEPWSKMVKREILEKHSINFDEVIIHNDTKFSYLVGYYCSNVAVDNRAIYCVTDRKNSVSKQISFDRLLIRTKVFSEANSFFKEKGISYFEEKAMRPMMRFIISGKFDEYKQCKQIIKQSGLCGFSLYIRQLIYPFLLLKKYFLKKKYKKSLI